MTAHNAPAKYAYSDGDPSHTHEYLIAEVQRFLQRVAPGRVLEIGCGNGSLAAWIHGQGVDVTGIDTSESGIAQARASHPGIRFEIGSAYDDLAGSFGLFPAVVSLEVIEHLYDPRLFATRLFNVLDPGGSVCISTPYHGYLKNLALAATGKMDSHFTALWDGGHIKFWSVATLGHLLKEAGFIDIQFRRVGRLPVLAKSLVAFARKPGP
jgi:2-polyprenyl-6-hydroxyphenyl methylase/3-demethylubiquinone-9 3-methyltransferase